MEKEYIEKVLKTIKNLRISQNLTQIDIANKVGMSTSFYGMIERGCRTLNLEYLIRISQALDCDLIDLLIISENNSK